ncbi:MAG: hypothetical protein ACX93O_15955 [Flagellimonas sp.]
MKSKLFLLVLFGPLLVMSQVKVGGNPEVIDPGSILELESTNKVLVLTRLNNEQMSDINPLDGALVYNTDTSCLHYHNGNQWINLCQVLSGTTFTDNGDGSITLEDGLGDETTFNGAPEMITTLINNMDGTYTYTNEAGNQTLINVTDTDNQTLGTDGTPGHIQISNGNSIVLNVDDSDADDQNEIQNLEFNGGIISLSNDPGNTLIDLSNYDNDLSDDFDGLWSSLTGIPAGFADDIDNDTQLTDAQVATAVNNEFPNLDTDATDDFDGDWSSLTNIPADIADGDDNTVTTLNQDNLSGVITYTNESAVNQSANVVSSDANNVITAGSDGGAFYESPVKAFGKIASDGSVVRATAGITITKLAGSGHYRINLPVGLVSDANYIIQIAQPSREGVGNDDPSISYLNQLNSSFEVIIGDNDNGGTDTGRFDSGFMFTILDL